MEINFTLFMQAAAFFAFIWFCGRFIWPPLMGAIDNRQKQIAEGLAAGEAGRQSLANTEKRIGEMLAEAKTRSSDIIAQGEKLKADAIETAKTLADAEAQRIIAAAKSEIEQEVMRARESLRDQVSSLAVAGASKILQREVDATAHAQLLADIRRQL